MNKPVYLTIGSIIGIDSEMAHSMGQNRITNAFSSPPEVYFNGNKISEIQINGDGQRIRVPVNLIKRNQVNEVTIRTGRNLMQTAYIDYDDIEFMNLFFENWVIKRKVLQNVQDSKIYIYPTNFIPHNILLCQAPFILF